MAFLGFNMHPLATAKLVFLKFDTSFLKGIKGVILAHPYIISRMKACSSLTNNNVSRYHPLHNTIKNHIPKQKPPRLTIKSLKKYPNLRKDHALTSPPNFFTPRFLGLESRPFLVDPAVFLVAQRLNIKLNPPADPSKRR